MPKKNRFVDFRERTVYPEIPVLLEFLVAKSDLPLVSTHKAKTGERSKRKLSHHTKGLRKMLDDVKL
jgi:hypothetical protein